MLLVLVLFQGPETNLDMQCILTLEGDFPVEKFSKEYELFVPASIIIKKDHVELMYYLPESVDNTRDVNIFLKSFKARKIGRVWTIYTNSKHFPELRYMKTLTNIPSVVFDAMYLENGVHYLYFRFHHSFVKTVSEALMEGENIPRGLSIEYLGPSKGLLNILQKINEKLSLSIISVTTKPPKEELGIDRNPVSSGNWTREIKVVAESDNIQAVYFTDGPLKLEQGQKVSTVCENEHIYEAKTENKVIGFYSSINGRIALPTVSRIQRFDGSSFRIETVLPDLFKSEYLIKISESLSRFPEWNIVLEDVRKIGEMLK